VAGSGAVYDTVSAGGTGSATCSGASTSRGGNLSDASSCVSRRASGDMTNTAAVPGPPQNNGGQTWTHLPQGGSPAINHGGYGGCGGVDQRGVYRPQNGACDIGSVEVAYPAGVGGTNPSSRAAGTSGFQLTVFGGNFNPG